MKKLFYGQLLLVIATLCFGQEATKRMPVVVGPTMKIVKVSTLGSITLEISNPSKKPLKLWEESNSWGATNWRALRIRQGQIETFFQNPYQVFTGNIPLFNEIPAGARLERKLDLNGGNWCGFGHCASYNEQGFGDGKKVTFEPGDTIIAVYDVPPTKESQELGVWTGVVAAFKTVE
jgi:hypothetical protein